MFWFWTRNPALVLSVLFRAVVGSVLLWARSDLWETETDDEVLDLTLLATEAVVAVFVWAAVEEVCVKFWLFLGWITVGMSPVFVLTIGPRLILTLELPPNLLFDFVTAVLPEFLAEGGFRVFGCFLRWLAAIRLDLEDTALYVVVSTGFCLGFACATPEVADGRLVFCRTVRILSFTFTLFAIPNAPLAGCFADWVFWLFVLSYLNLSAGVLFSFPLTTCKTTKWLEKTIARHGW